MRVGIAREIEALEGQDGRAALLAGAVKGDALPGLHLRGDYRMPDHSGKNRRGGGGRERRHDHRGRWKDMIRALFADHAAGAMRGHHAMMRAVSAAAYGHAGLLRGGAKERHREGQHEEHQQRNGQHSAHTIIMADGPWASGVVPTEDSGD